MKLKLGIIGMSEGNGHPYSWSAIFNGYNADHMKNCPFPAIPEYLDKEKYPDNFLSDAEITHIYTQDIELSQHISLSSNISHVVSDLSEMLSEVDGVLLARDDSENHFKYALPCLEAGLPIFIDKPIATNPKDLNRLLSAQQYKHQIYTCSALRYAKELITHSVQDIVHIEAITPKSWEKYAVHIIEPVLQIIGHQNVDIQSHTCFIKNDIHKLFVELNKTQTASFTSVGNIPHPLQLKIFGKSEYTELTFMDSFSAFKESLNTFVKQIQLKDNIISRTETQNIVSIIELGK